ncbi:MAG: DUF4267 domain-containing protein [Vicinamibacterales bacterium]
MVGRTHRGRHCLHRRAVSRRTLPASAAFGVPADGTPTLAYQWAKGTRDIVSGLLVIALMWSGAGRRVLAVFMAVAAVIPFGDLINVYANVGTHNPLALAIHGGTAAGMLALAWGLKRVNSGATSAAASSGVHRL